MTDAGLCHQSRLPIGPVEFRQIEIRQQRRHDIPLRGTFIRFVDEAIFHHTGFQEALDQRQNASISHTLLDEIEQNRVRDMESRWGAWPALRRVGFPTALPRTGQAAWRSIRLSRLALASTLSQV